MVGDTVSLNMCQPVNLPQITKAFGGLAYKKIESFVSRLLYRRMSIIFHHPLRPHQDNLMRSKLIADLPVNQMHMERG